MEDFINSTDLEFIDISSEQYRKYNFVKDGVVVSVLIQNPLWLNAGANGHRVTDLNGENHYIPMGWFQLTWKAHPGQPNYVK